jgi:WD40 repeat protein
LIPAHAAGVHAVAYSPDGTRLVSAGSDGMLRIWSSEGQQLLELKGHRSIVTSVAWSPDGQWLSSGGSDSSVRLWKADGTSSQELKGHTKGVMAVAWSPDGIQFATGGGDATVRIWDLNGKELHVMAGHTSNVCSLAWNSRGSRLASGSWDNTIRFWNPKTGRGGPVLEGHTYRVNALEWHPEGSMLASGGDQTLRLWTLDGTPVRTVKTEVDHILTLSWKHDGNEIVTGSRFSSILRVVDLNNASERVTGESTQAGVNALAWHPSGDRIAVGCRDRKIRLMTEDGRAGAILSGPVVRTVEWSPNGERLASGGDALLRLWNGQVIPLSASKEHAKNIVALAWSPDGKFVATVSQPNLPIEWTINAAMPSRSIIGQSGHFSLRKYQIHTGRAKISEP